MSGMVVIILGVAAVAVVLVVVVGAVALLAARDDVSDPDEAAEVFGSADQPREAGRLGRT